MIKYIFFGAITLAAIPALVAPVPHQDPVDLERLVDHVERDVYSLERKVDSIVSIRSHGLQDNNSLFIFKFPVQLTKSLDNATDINANVSEDSNDR